MLPRSRSPGDNRLIRSRSKSDNKRQRRSSESVPSAVRAAEIEDDSDDQTATSKSKVKGDGSLSSRTAALEKKEQEKERARAEAAGRRQERARSRRGDGRLMSFQPYFLSSCLLHNRPRASGRRRVEGCLKCQGISSSALIPAPIPSASRESFLQKRSGQEAREEAWQ